MNKLKITSEKTAKINDFYGIFFEDINHAADGGLYSELIRNRAFEFSPIDNPRYQSLTAWKRIELGGASVSASVSDKSPFSKRNPHYLVLSVDKVGERAGIKNLGYNSGIPMFKGKKYDFTCLARGVEGTELFISIDDPYGKSYQTNKITLSGDGWQKYSCEFTGVSDDFSCTLAITLKKEGKVELDFCSLFPQETFKNRKNGLRSDLAELLADLKPRFVRFPGGCLIHDGSMNKDDRNSAYRWKNTIGEIYDRPARRNNWGYNQSLGLGYYEYFLFCEDLGAEPLPVLPAGYNPHMEQGVPFDELGEWIDEALDLIEFANGSTDTKWGAIRAELGHKEPFDLKYIAIGNEEVGQGFFDRYDYFHKAIKERYPEILIINSAGPFAYGGEYERGWNNAKKNGSDIIDEHYYMAPEWYLANHHRYDSFSTEGPKIFLGEYASWGNTYYNALVEAAYMTGLENNADKISLVCYAPLLCNADYVNWQPDMIWFDNHRSYGSANYYVQKLFMNNIGSSKLAVEKEGLDKVKVLGKPTIGGMVSIEADGVHAEFTDISITDNVTGEVKSFDAITATKNGLHDLAKIDSQSYTVCFKAVRHFGTKGFKLFFGFEDFSTHKCWNIGGWANQDTEISARINSRGSTLDQNIFSVETDVVYDLKLEVNGREITTYINGKKANTAVDRLPEIEELYYTASIDEMSGRIFVKAVNVNSEPVAAELEFEGAKALSAEVSELSGIALDAMNSFENPKAVYPTQATVTSDTGTLSYEFPPESVTVFEVSIC